MGLLSFQVSLARIWRRHKQWDKREAYGQCAWWMRAPFYVKEAYSSFSGSSAGKLRKLPGHHFYFFMATMGIQYLPFIEEKNLELVYTIFWKYAKHLGFNSPCERRSLIIKGVKWLCQAQDSPATQKHQTGVAGHLGKFQQTFLLVSVWRVSHEGVPRSLFNMLHCTGKTHNQSLSPWCQQQKPWCGRMETPHNGNKRSQLSHPMDFSF